MHLLKIQCCFLRFWSSPFKLIWSNFCFRLMLQIYRPVCVWLIKYLNFVNGVRKILTHSKGAMAFSVQAIGFIILFDCSRRPFRHTNTVYAEERIILSSQGTNCKLNILYRHQNMSHKCMTILFFSVQGLYSDDCGQFTKIYYWSFVKFCYNLI